jgi:hypothetical protein
MSPKPLVISTTYKTRVGLPKTLQGMFKKPCWTVNGQASFLKFSRSALKCPNQNDSYFACICNQLLVGLPRIPAHGDNRS